MGQTRPVYPLLSFSKVYCTHHVPSEVRTVRPGNCGVSGSIREYESRSEISTEAGCTTQRKSYSQMRRHYKPHTCGNNKGNQSYRCKTSRNSCGVVEYGGCHFANPSDGADQTSLVKNPPLLSSTFIQQSVTRAIYRRKKEIYMYTSRMFMYI
ncbi:hypothetical protein NPIL_136501 [Nephila pilipes]|uniref:Uncharacterized protein n=1 Tax=Nephila pilipes TaxID=299642 RepID=A0A8X6JX85_NEPPI|nr:hypothetical protein NPIL_136501 [Nephila pilipes]